MLDGKAVMGILLVSLLAILILLPYSATTGRSYMPYAPVIPDGGVVKGSTVHLGWKVSNTYRATAGIDYGESYFVSPGWLFKIRVSGEIPVNCLTYEVYFGENQQPLYHKTIECSNEIIIEGLQKGRVYYWYIVVIDADGNRYTGPTWHFYTR